MTTCTPTPSATVSSFAEDATVSSPAATTCSTSDVVLTTCHSPQRPTPGVVVEIVRENGQSTIQQFSPGEEVIFSVRSVEEPSSVTCASPNYINTVTRKELNAHSPSFQELVPIPHLSRSVSKAKKRPVRHAEELTSTPQKNQLQETGGKAMEAGPSIVR